LRAAGESLKKAAASSGVMFFQPIGPYLFDLANFFAPRLIFATTAGNASNSVSTAIFPAIAA
jgi:hypothetical protein